MTTQSLLEALKRIGSHRIVLFWGSGIVKSLGYPSWESMLGSAADFAKQYEPTLSEYIRSRLKKGNFFGAGDLLLGEEIPVSARCEFLVSLFDKSPTLSVIHKNLTSSPFAAFITTNYDRTIEQALTSNGKTPESFAHVDRFSRFNSRLSVYSSGTMHIDAALGSTDPQRLQNGLVLKLHGDITSPEDIVLGSSQLATLMETQSFIQLYRRLLSTYSLMFIGYSGRDPAFEWHCKSLLPVCGVPSSASYLLHPQDDTPPTWIKEAGIVPVPFSSESDFKELSLFAADLSLHFRKPDVLSIVHAIDAISDEQLVSLAFVLVGLTEGQHMSGFSCAVNSVVAEAASQVGGLEDERLIAEHVSRTYHFPFAEAIQLVQKADRVQVRSLVEKHSIANANLQNKIDLLSKGIAARARALGMNYTHERSRQIVMDVLVQSLSVYGNALALILTDAESPDSSLIDRVVRASIVNLNLSGIGSLDKEMLQTCFADLFIHPSTDESNALLLLAQAALAHSLATTFSGGLGSLKELLPAEAYLDSNVSIPLVAKDHPRSSYYNELSVRLMRSDCKLFVLDVFLNEMENHCRRAYQEVNAASIKTVQDARNYADFHGILWINAFLASFANGGRETESFEAYIERISGARKPSSSNFRRLLQQLGVEVLSTSMVDKSQCVALATHIAYEKGRLMRLKAQVLADHEALQVQWLHSREDVTSWFITEDLALRRILRELPTVAFSRMAPSKGIVPAQGAFLILSTIGDRPSLEGSFVQFLWNPLYVELVDSMLASVIRKMPDHFKQLKQAGFADIREKISRQMQREMERTDKDDLMRRVKEYKLGRPEIVESILRAIGEQDRR